MAHCEGWAEFGWNVPPRLPTQAPIRRQGLAEHLGKNEVKVTFEKVFRQIVDAPAHCETTLIFSAEFHAGVKSRWINSDGTVG